MMSPRRSGEEIDDWNCAEGERWIRIGAENADPTSMVNLGLLYLNGHQDRVLYRIGVELKQTDRGIAIESITQGSPADDSGIRPADVVVTVNGRDAQKLGLNGVADAIRASKNKAVVIEIRRADLIQLISVTPQEIRFKCPGADSSGLRTDHEEAIKWFERAAERGNQTGLLYLAEAYRKGTGVPLDYKKALIFYERGAERGDWRAALAISQMYTSGESGEINEELAKQWRRRAEDLKHKTVWR